MRRKRGVQEKSQPGAAQAWGCASSTVAHSRYSTPAQWSCLLIQQSSARERQSCYPFLRWNGTELGRQHRSWTLRQESGKRKAGGSICYTQHGGSTDGINFLANLIGISGHFKLLECMLVCAYGHTCAECMYVCVETKAQSNLSLCRMLPTFFFWDTVSHWHRGHQRSARLTGQWPPGSTCLSLPVSEILSVLGSACLSDATLLWKGGKRHGSLMLVFNPWLSILPPWMSTEQMTSDLWMWMFKCLHVFKHMAQSALGTSTLT